MLKKTMGPSPNWPKVFTEWESSGQNQRDFCTQKGYSYSRFKDARVKHGYSRARHRRKKSLPSPGPKAGSQGGLFAVSIDKEQVDRPATAAKATEQPEIELKLPFGVVLTFRGAADQ